MVVLDTEMFKTAVHRLTWIQRLFRRLGCAQEMAVSAVFVGITVAAAFRRYMCLVMHLLQPPHFPVLCMYAPLDNFWVVLRTFLVCWQISALPDALMHSSFVPCTVCSCWPFSSYTGHRLVVRQLRST